MLGQIDLNADIGEAETQDGIAAELSILSYVSSANIACGGHRGDVASMQRTAAAAMQKGIAIGAHPSYPDRVHFGRRSHRLGVDIAASRLIESLMEQIVSLCEVTAQLGGTVGYVKPHGALYNDAVKSALHADLIAGTIARLDPKLVLLGGPNSQMQRAAEEAGLSFVAEGFIDRRYTKDGHLQSRQIEGAVITKQTERMAQARSLAAKGAVITVDGDWLDIKPQSLCLHGDSQGAVETARMARAEIEAAGLTIRSFVKV